MRQLILQCTVFQKNQFPESELPQISLVGRSNVGKSSLINTLANNKNLARTSRTPGKTQSINFYEVLPQSFFLVDLPGYGYARRSQKDRIFWAELINYYFTTSKKLGLVLILIDSSIPPQKNDIATVAFLESQQIPFAIILTKSDQGKRNERDKNRAFWEKNSKPITTPLFFSSREKIGIESLKNIILTHIANL